MLILQRNKGESFIIFLPDGRQVEITLLKITGPYQTKIGVEAPKDIKILRRELLSQEPNQ